MLKASPYTEYVRVTDGKVIIPSTITSEMCTCSIYVPNSNVNMNGKTFKPMISRNPNAPYEPYYPSNKELASTRPALKSMEISGTTNANGVYEIPNNIIPILFVWKGSVAKYHWFGSLTYNNIAHKYLKIMNEDGTAMANEPFTSTLYYYDL